MLDALVQTLFLIRQPIFHQLSYFFGEAHGVAAGVCTPPLSGVDGVHAGLCRGHVWV